MIETAKDAKETPVEPKLKPSGPAMAVLLSAAIGVFVSGLATVLASASTAVNDALNWWNPAGPLTGKTGVGVIAWLVTWTAAHALWHDKEIAFKRVWIVSLILIFLGMVMMFPPVFQTFEAHK